METQNLWPDFAIETTKSPKAILKEQAGYLMAKTNNLLSADVQTGQNNQDSIVHDFYIVAPALNNYRFRVLTIVHEAIYYPLTVFWDKYNVDFTAENQEEFIELLRKIFKDPSTIQVISSLLSQSLAE
ncbi:hypothetical protein ACFSUS_10820 [Spirosoma soli]|uniref:Uncharacterized protein n=1 Tax=Spirosoma soli TaxID=1770529 RepID=A0ABW5M3C1_9BACT